MRKINTIGIKQANKVMLMPDKSDTLKKHLKFVAKTAQSNKEEVKACLDWFFWHIIDQLCFNNLKSAWI
jgi:hypothetical protein